jgi:hypothetical protein
MTPYPNYSPGRKRLINLIISRQSNSLNKIIKKMAAMITAKPRQTQDTVSNPIPLLLDVQTRTEPQKNGFLFEIAIGYEDAGKKVNYHKGTLMCLPYISNEFLTYLTVILPQKNGGKRKVTLKEISSMNLSAVAIYRCGLPLKFKVQDPSVL